MLASISVTAISPIVSAQQAPSTDAPDFAKLDGIVGRCVVSTKRKYAVRLCTRLLRKTRELSRLHKIQLVDLGINPVETGPAATGNTGMDNPLHLIFFVRGTDGKTVGASVRIEATIFYSGAVENKNNAGLQQARKGKLVLWQEAAVASGPARKIGSALAGHMASKLDQLIELFASRDNNQ